MTRTNEDAIGLEARAAWSVVVVYEDSAARERAVVFCDQLVRRFWERFEFEVSWWSFAMLGQPTALKGAAENAARADLIAISTTPEGGLPPAVGAWIEATLRLRGKREGMLAGLMAPPGNLSGWEGWKHHYLRNVAHRAAMDYLTQVPPNIAHPVPDSLDTYSERAEQMTSVLDGILHQQAPPPHLVA